MQYLRDRLSLNPPLDQTTSASLQRADHAAIEIPHHSGTPPIPPNRKQRNGPNASSELTVSPTISTFSGATAYHSTGGRGSSNAGTPPSAYSTPFQSPVVSERWPPHSHSVHPQQITNSVVQVDKDTPSPTNVFVIDRGHLSGYPRTYSAPAPGAYVNNAFTNDNGQNVLNTDSFAQPHVIREQYWSWSCKCQRELSNREKILLLVVIFLLLIIGGLAAYLGIISDDRNPLQGGLLTPGGLHST
ncbi:uncharacterized protein LOC129731295 [Wyeomyia smithii]|uniref:uncharacterized protein LOC129731295 n=1 Tax=Wyeomyia smithii TaxID=174621 RepID=UPI002467CC9C|nr:uncharacterized protein LOC129731295 [Wyeomyia smithii]